MTGDERRWLRQRVSDELLNRIRHAGVRTVAGNCEHCNTRFPVSPRMPLAHPKRFCSAKCCHAAWRQRNLRHVRDYENAWRARRRAR